MLRLLRRFVKPDGRLFYTLFINEATEGGHGYIDRLTEWLDVAVSTDPMLKEALAARGADREPPDYVDTNPNDPLWVALYSRRHALELIEGTGWRVLEVAPPDVHLQHHIVCAIGPPAMTHPYGHRVRRLRGRAHLVQPIDPDDPPEPGDILTYRCEDCADRWDLVVEEADLTHE